MSVPFKSNIFYVRLYHLKDRVSSLEVRQNQERFIGDRMESVVLEFETWSMEAREITEVQGNCVPRHDQKKGYDLAPHFP